MKQLRVSSALNLHSYPREDMCAYIKEGLRFQKEAGFDAVDCSTSLFDLTSDAWQGQVEQVLRDAEDIGICCELSHLPFIGISAVQNEAYLTLFSEKMHRAIDVAATLGVKYAVIHPNGGNILQRQYDRTAQLDMIKSHFEPFIEHAARVGLNVVVENMRAVPGMRLAHRFAQDADELCDLADAFGIGICWDFGHANISAMKQSEALAYIGKRLKVIHVNDNAAIDDEHLLPFEGNVDWRDAMHGLALADFDGLFNFELSTGKLPASMRPAFAAYVLAAARELMSYIE